jgi:CysZ protein
MSLDPVIRSRMTSNQTPASPRAASEPGLGGGVACVGDFLNGVGDFWRGAAFLLARPSLWPWAAIPFLLNVAVFVAVAWVGWHFGSAEIGRLLHATGDHWWSTVLGWLAGILFWLVMGAIVVFGFVPMATLVASPFNDALSEKVERLYAGVVLDRGFSPGRLARGLWCSLRGSLALTLKTLALMAVALPLYLLPPPLGVVAGPAAQALIAIRFLALQMTAYSMDRRFYPFRQREAFLRANRWRTIGLGAMSFLAMTIPVANALFIPISAVAGTLLFCDVELRRRRQA